MKKLSLFILCFVTVFCYSNDIIITKQSEKIEATIVEVSKSEIKYRKASNPTGPMFVIDVEEISSIIYNNGEVEAFNAQTSTNNILNILNNGSLITRLGNNLYVYKGTTMDSKELGAFFQSNCQEAYRHWKSGAKKQELGIAGVVLGPVLCLPVGLSLYVRGYNHGYINERMCYSGIFFMAFGASMAVASIPVLAVGVVDKNNAYLTYNDICAKSQNPVMSLNFQVNTDGVGLAFKF